jgi:hypothetical protein
MSLQMQQRGSIACSGSDQSQTASFSPRRRPRHASKSLRKRQPSLLFYALLSISGVFVLNGAYLLTRMPSSSTVSSKASYPRGRRAQGLRIYANEIPSEEDEDWLLSRIFSAQDERRKQCTRDEPRFDLNATGFASSSRRLRPFGLRLDLINYRRAFHARIGRRDASGSSRVTMQATCRFIKPSSQACGVSSYAIIAPSVVTWSYDSAVDVDMVAKTLVLNCLQWLLDSSAGEVWIVLPSHAESALKLPAIGRGYVSRLWGWNSMAAHPVKLLFAADPWNAIEEIYSRTREAVVIWRNGSSEFRGSVNETQRGLGLWRESPVRLYALRTVSFPSLARSVCAAPSESELLPTGSSRATAWKLPDIVDGLIHHTGYLCFAGHPVTEQIRFASAGSNGRQLNETWSSLWHDTMLAMSLWVAHASSSATTSSPGQWLQLYASQDMRAEDHQTIDLINSSGNAVGEIDEKWGPGSGTFADLLSYFGGIPKLLITFETPESSSTACGI